MTAPQTDAISGPPDGTRPANPWPRLIAFGLVVLGVLFLLGLCVATFASPPPRELRVPTAEVEPGLPRFLAVTTFGADAAGFTYGAYLLTDARGNATALLSREHDSLCNLGWEPNERVGEHAGVYVDRCSDARYTAAGTALHEGATRDLHTFAVRIEGRDYVVSVSAITLGTCRGETREGCSPPGGAVERRTPSGLLGPEFGNR